MANNQNSKATTLAKRMTIALIAGLVAGLGCLFLRESLTSGGNAEIWNTINNLLFQDITAAGAESALGLFYLLGQLFIKALQLIIVPMVFTSIVMAIGQITDTRTLGRISFKTIMWFLISSFTALIFACLVGILVYNSGLFSAQIENLASASGKTGSNPLNVILNIVPNNILTAFSSNSAVLSVVFLAVGTGLCMNALGEEKTQTMKKFIQELNDVVVMFLNFVVLNFAPVAIFMLLTRTFAVYGINYLKPAAAYVVVTVLLLLVFLFVGYPLLVLIGAKVNPLKFIRKISNVAMFGFSTSSSAATLPMNVKTTTEDIGADNKISSFVLPLGMTINMDGTAIMQVIATLFIAGCAGYEVNLMSLFVIGMLALIASAGTPAAPGAGAVILFTILSGVGFTSDAAMLAYALILAINRPIEMLVTALNVVGDSATAVIVAKSENLLDEKKYNA